MASLDSVNGDIPLFTLKGFTTDAKIVRVYDGDTVHAVFLYGGQYHKWNCRIAHVDTPELRTKDLAEKQKGIEARDYLRGLILDKIVKLDCFEFDKYGRLLVEITLPETNEKVHECLLSNNHAHPYEGATKQKWN
jgi:endonuclease YncB( thermonuclease family)